jgi:hypothetical protein
MSQELLNRIKELKSQTNAEIDDLIDAWEELAEEFDMDDDSTDEPRLYCSRIADALTETSDELSTFKPSEFQPKLPCVGVEDTAKVKK